jgi:XRE family transcriptional regulator, fatty acid utilization regulator
MNAVSAPNTLSYLPRRIVAAREKCSLTQEELAQRLGFKDRQILASIEAGQRRITAEELVAISDITHLDLDFFTDPFRLVGEGAFSYRASGVEPAILDAFEQQVGGWVALWRQLGERRREPSSLLRPRLAMNTRSTFEEAQFAGEMVVNELNLGPVPAEKLIPALESKFNLLVLEVAMPEGISGAAIQLAAGDAILINRDESPGRKAFDLAHELFHVLTWDALPPERVDRSNPTAYKQKRIEQLADNFAGALLLPRSALHARWEKLAKTHAPKTTINEMADYFHVSTMAVGWRAVALDWLTTDELKALDLQSAKPKKKSNPHAIFSKRFIERAAWGIDHGEISVKRLLAILDMTLADFRACCLTHNVNLEIGL